MKFNIFFSIYIFANFSKCKIPDKITCDSGWNGLMVAKLVSMRGLILNTYKEQIKFISLRLPFRLKQQQTDSHIN